MVFENTWTGNWENAFRGLRNKPSALQEGVVR